MADSVLNVTLTGAKELSERLETMKDFANNEMAKALNKAANDARQFAVAKAPHKSGRLWNSIHIENANPSNLIAKVGTKLAYARAQEYGTQGMQIHGRSKLGKQFTYIGNIKPKFYMRDAKLEIKPKLSSYLQLAARRIVGYLATGR